MATSPLEQFVRGAITLREVSGIDGPRMQKMAQTAYRWFQEGRFQDARMAFEGLIALEPRGAYFWSALAGIDLAEGDLAFAKDRATYAISLNDKELGAYVNRGEALMRTGRLPEAVRDFKRVAELDPKGKDPMSQRARLLAQSLFDALKAAQAKSKRPAKP